MRMRAPDEAAPALKPGQVRLKKAFTHFGVQYQAGDVFSGDGDEIAALIRQGYADDPNAPAAPSAPEDERSEEKP